MSEAEKHVARIREVSRRDIYMEVDGYYVYAPSRVRGFIEAPDLRVIADLLDEMNAEWDNQVQNDLTIGASQPPPNVTRMEQL